MRKHGGEILKIIYSYTVKITSSILAYVRSPEGIYMGGFIPIGERHYPVASSHRDSPCPSIERRRNLDIGVFGHEKKSNHMLLRI
jgi:hypothetical protein